MGLLKIRDEMGVVREVVALKGEPGGFSPHTHPVEEIFHGEATVDKFLGEVADKATDAITKATGAANDVMTLGAQLDEHAELVETVRGQADAADSKAQTALANAGENRDLLLDVVDRVTAGEEQLGGIESTIEEIVITNGVQDDTIFSLADRVNVLEEQTGGIEASLDGIINIQNILIGGGA